MQVIPGINCPDLACASEKIEAAKKFLPPGAFLHLDVTDGAFTFHKVLMNPTEWASLRSPFPAEVHLMVEHPEIYVDPWISAGAKRFIFHVETINETLIKDILQKCAARGAEAVLSSNPETPVEKMASFKQYFNSFQVLSVYPGPSAQSFLPLSLDKIKFLRAMAPNATIEVDGGINLETANLVKAAGANTVVSTSFIFGASDPKQTYQTLENI